VISILIPVKNGGDDLRRCLEAIARQRVDDEVETVIVDSGSRDGSVEYARSMGASVHEIPPAEFNHGATRNVLGGLAKGDLFVFTSQDAYAEGDDWLERITAPLREDERVAGVYGRQLPHHDASASEQYFLGFLYGAERRVQQAASTGELSMDTTLFSNANAAIRRSAWEEFRFVDDIIMSEDQEWSRRVLLAGHRLVYEPRAAVRHSHPYTIKSAFRRFFDSGVSAERAYLAGQAPSREVLRRRSRDYARGELRWLWQSGHRSGIPYAVVYEGAKWLGLQLGSRHRRLPLWAKRRMSALPTYWDR
jgi:rhamnosyltransferase